VRGDRVRPNFPLANVTLTILYQLCGRLINKRGASQFRRLIGASRDAISPWLFVPDRK